MKKTCEQTKRLMELMDGALLKSEKKALKKHIEGCDDCRSFIQDFNKIDTSLSCHKRIKPSESFFQLYHKSLSVQLGNALPVRRRWIDGFLLHPVPVMRMAHALGMLILGISLGWLLFHQDEPAIRKSNVVIVQRSPSSVQQVHAFFQESEIWLLDTMNLPQNGGVTIQDWNMTHQQAEQLLRKIGVIRGLTETYEEPRLQRTLDGLEILFLELINSQENDRSESIIQIKQSIAELDLLFKVNILCDYIQMTDQHI